MTTAPEQLYRGIALSAQDVAPGHFYDDLVPGSKRILPDGSAVVMDGNPYGVYMSTNRHMVEQAYAYPRHGTLLPGMERMRFGIRQDQLREPSVGILYTIDPVGLDIRQPDIAAHLQLVHNNGYVGQEWITNRVPTTHFRVETIRLSEDPLHPEFVITPNTDNYDNLPELMAEEAKTRRERLLKFGEALAELTPGQRRHNFPLVQKIIGQLQPPRDT